LAGFPLRAFQHAVLIRIVARDDVAGLGDDAGVVIMLPTVVILCFAESGDRAFLKFVAKAGHEARLRRWLTARTPLLIITAALIPPWPSPDGAETAKLREALTT